MTQPRRYEYRAHVIILFIPIVQIMAKDFNCEEDFNMIDRRLFLCTLACSFSVFALVYDYLSPFPRSGTVLAICAIRYPLTQDTHTHTYTYIHTYTHTLSLYFLTINISTYFILMGVLSFYTMLVEGSVFMVARQKDPAGMVRLLQIMIVIYIHYDIGSRCCMEA